MKRLQFLMLGFVFFYGQITAQSIHRASGENTLTFIINNTPKGLSFCSECKDQIFETAEWSSQKSVFGFYKRKYKLPDDDYDYEDILGYLYVPVTPDTYKRIFIDTFENEGGTAEISSIFFANADKDSARELVILIKWEVIHYQIGGYLYETRIYDNITPGEYPYRLEYLKNISSKVSGGFDGDREGEHVVSKYKNAKEIRAGLKMLGY